MAAPPLWCEASCATGRSHHRGSREEEGMGGRMSSLGRDVKEKDVTTWDGGHSRNWRGGEQWLWHQCGPSRRALPQPQVKLVLLGHLLDPSPWGHVSMSTLAPFQDLQGRPSSSQAEAVLSSPPSPRFACSDAAGWNQACRLWNIINGKRY